MGIDNDLDDEKGIDRDDNAIAGDEMPYEKLLEMLKGDDEDGDDIAFGKTSDTPAPEVETVSIEDGIDLIDKAQSGKREAAKVEAKVDPEPETEAKPEGEDSAPAAAPDELDTILAAVPEASREAVRTRITAADEMMGLFKGREADLERFGTTPAKAVGELLKIEAYSRSKPDEYLAWAASQLGGDPVATITKAAERLGLKISAASDDDDPFEDPEVKQMRAELAAFKARETGPSLGPDAPQNRVMNDLATFKAEATHFDAVAPYVAAQAKAHVEATGKPVTVTDLKRFYDANVAALGLAEQAAQTIPAAQTPPPVAQEAQTTPAAPSDSVKRAMAASKSLDGSGHGAGRRPALAADAPLSEVLGHFYKQSTQG